MIIQMTPWNVTSSQHLISGWKFLYLVCLNKYHHSVLKLWLSKPYKRPEKNTVVNPATWLQSLAFFDNDWCERSFTTHNIFQFLVSTIAVSFCKHSHLITPCTYLTGIGRFRMWYWVAETSTDAHIVVDLLRFTARITNHLLNGGGSAPRMLVRIENNIMYLVLSMCFS